MSERNSPARVRASIIIRKNNEVLLINAAKGPFKGKWGFPGGGIEEYESLEETAIREAKEETGLDVKLLGLNLIADEKIKMCADCGMRHHGITFFFDAEPTGGELCRGDAGVLEMKWVPEKDLEKYEMRGITKLALSKHGKKIVATEE